MHHFHVVLHISRSRQNDRSRWQLNAWDMSFRNWYIDSQKFLKFSEFQQQYPGYIPRDEKGKIWTPFKLHWVAFVDPEVSTSASLVGKAGCIYEGITIDDCKSICDIFVESNREITMSGEYDTESVCSSITELSRINDDDLRLDLLNENLKKLHVSKGLSMKAIKGIIGAKGICLKNSKEYGSKSQLTKKLKNNKRLRVKREEMKKYKYARHCLVNYASRL